MEAEPTQKMDGAPVKEMWNLRPGNLEVLPGELLSFLGVCCSQDIIRDPAYTLSAGQALSIAFTSGLCSHQYPCERHSRFFDGLGSPQSFRQLFKVRKCIKVWYQTLELGILLRIHLAILLLIRH
jgi:hypothetical protein